MKRVLNHLRMHMFRGLLAVIPLVLCAVAIQLLYVLIDQRVISFFEKFIEIRRIPGLGILLVLLSLYLIGFSVSSFLGRQIFKFIEHVSQRIPVVNVIYGIGKQFSQSLAPADQKDQAFKKAVLIKMVPGPLMVPAFVMSSITDKKAGEELLIVYTPTVPTPTGGFIFMVKASEVIDPGWNQEESLKLILSMGIIPPKETSFDSAAHANKKKS